MIEAYIIALLGLNLVGHTRDAINENNMLNEFQAPLIKSVADEHPANTTKLGGTLTISLSDNHRNWILRYYYQGGTGAGLVLTGEELTKKSILSPREGTLQDYKTRVERQRLALINFVQPQIEENNKLGKLPTVGFGAGDILYKSLYTGANLKWRVNGRSWETGEGKL